MKHSWLLKIVPAALIMSGLGACGGGSGGSGGSGTVTVGQITGFGSVHVNGTRFETTNSSFSVDDNDGVQDDLHEGMVVTVHGSTDEDGLNGVADSIEYDDEVKGPITSAITDNGVSKSFTVLGTTVIVDGNTWFDKDDLTFNYDTIAQYDVVEVSGLYDGTGALVATYIEKQSVFDPNNPGNTHIEVKGTVSGLSGSSFSLDALSVTFDASTDLSDLPGGAVANGIAVEVKGVLTDAAGTSVAASEIEQEHEKLENHVGEISLEGIVSDYNSNGNFKVAGHTVDASAALFEPASLSTSLADGMYVEVEGTLAGDVLQAREVGLETHMSMSP